MMYLSYIEHIIALFLETHVVSTDRNHGFRPWRYNCNVVVMGVALRKPVRILGPYFKQLKQAQEEVIPR
jgi:hypothetical protein